MDKHRLVAAQPSGAARCPGLAADAVDRARKLPASGLAVAGPVGVPADEGAVRHPADEVLGHGLRDVAEELRLVLGQVLATQLRHVGRALGLLLPFPLP
eukprot:15148428-Alexandrium_andersonii.AAC.1